MKMVPARLHCLIAGCLFAHAQAAEPPELPRLRASYEAAVQRATKPLTESYRNELVKLRDTYTKAGKLPEAVAIASELDGINLKLGLPREMPSIDAGVSKAATAPAGEKEITIPANDPNGVSIGPVNKGDVITLQYASGKWKSHGFIPTANPDDSAEPDDNRLVIALPTEKGGAGKLVKVVPAGTKDKPFKFMFPTSRPNVVLRINANSENPKNPGSVKYHMMITH